MVTRIKIVYLLGVFFQKRAILCFDSVTFASIAITCRFKRDTNLFSSEYGGISKLHASMIVSSEICTCPRKFGWFGRTNACHHENGMIRSNRISIDTNYRSCCWDNPRTKNKDLPNDRSKSMRIADEDNTIDSLTSQSTSMRIIGRSTPKYLHYH